MKKIFTLVLLSSSICIGMEKSKELSVEDQVKKWQELSVSEWKWIELTHEANNFSSMSERNKKLLKYMNDHNIGVIKFEKQNNFNEIFKNAQLTSNKKKKKSFFKKLLNRK